ncbi:MAG: ABC transporter ATP-binding protein [bacterium]|nr:ABC transporter ATP-binding protein [bacterium]
MQLIRTIWQLLGTHRRAFVALGLGSVAYEAVKAVGPTFVGGAIDAIAAPGGVDFMRVLAFVAGVAAVDLTAMGLDTLFDRRVLSFLYSVERDVHVAASDHALTLPLSFHEREQAGRLLTRINRGTTKLIEFLMDATWQGMPTIIQLVITFIAMALVHLPIALVYAVFVPAFLAIAFRQQRKERPFRRERHERYEDAAAHLDESIWNVLTVQSFGREAAAGTRYRGIFDVITRLGRQQWMIGTRHNFAKSAVVNSGRIAVICTAAWEAWRGAVSVGDVVLLATLAEKAFISCFNLSRILERIADAREPVERLRAFLAETPTVNDPVQPVRAELHGGITFDRVTFSYGDGAATALRDVSFAVKPGETIAFAGPSGGGKSTLVKLLFRHYDPTDGHVLLDDTDVRGFARADFRQQLGYVPQEGQLFSGTVAENIRFASPTATDVEVHAAAQLAGAETFIADLVKGYDTVIGEQGVKLSGGQRQRLCIARAVVARPKILVFDEATSALDVESERIIQDALERLRGSTTIIVIAHRLSTIRHADRILIVEGGRIVEEGSHAQLLRQNGLYQRLVQLQDTPHATR